MKKQILFLAMFTLALIFAGTYNVFGQTTSLSPGITSTNPIDPLTCVGTSLPLHPFPGVAYTYTMDGTTGAELADEWTWFATKDPNFIVNGVLNTAAMLTTASGDLLAVSGNYGVAGATNSVTITWSPEILANTVYLTNPTFVVGYATGQNCADNIQVYELNPRFNFTLDIASINEAGTTLDWDVAATECVSPVQSAVYNAGALDMDYGTDTLYFEVAAANFVNDFTPTFRLISGLATTQTADVSLHTTLADATTGANPVASTSWAVGDIGTDWATGQAFDATNAADVVSGVSFYVRVLINNLTEESLAASDFVIAVDAIDDGAAGQWDMEEDDCDIATASDSADQADTATSTVNPRPTIVMDGAAMSEPSGTVPENIIPKN